MDGPIRRLLALGDLHAEDEALAQALASPLAREADVVVAVGDLVDGPGDADRTCALLRDHGVVAVRGNHERWLLAGEMRHLPHATAAIAPATRAYLESLPVNVELETVAGRLLVSHGVGTDDEAELRPETGGYALAAALATVRDRADVRFFLGGHTHAPMVREIDGRVFMNAGTLARGLGHATGDGPVLFAVDFEQRTVELHASHRDGPPGPVVARFAFGG